VSSGSSTSILHDLRNPVGAIYAAAEMLMDLDPVPTPVKRLATNIYRAAGRMRELLAALNSVAPGNRSMPEMCDIREVIAAASDAGICSYGEPLRSDSARST
jgi:signal transduction histidine kinase